MKKTLSLLLFFIMALSVYSQQKTHVVQAKETVYGISRQYGISQDELVNANPFLKERQLQVGDELTIPGVNEVNNESPIRVTDISEPPSSNIKIDGEVQVPVQDKDFIFIVVKAGETVFSLTKAYNISEEALVSLNPQLKSGLKAGDIIRVPKKNNQQEEITPPGMYKVLKNETVYSLSNKFDISEDDFYIANPAVQTEGLKEGAYVNIPQKGKSNSVIRDGVIEHRVRQGETIYSLTRLYNTELYELLAQNPDLNDGLKAGMTLIIPLPKNANIIKIKDRIFKRKVDDEINIALLLPFHLDNPSGNKTEKQISGDLLIGAKMGLEAAAKKGKKIKLTVMDSDSQPESVDNLIAKYDFSEYDAVIGPLYASNFKYLNTILNGSGIAMISPLSNAEDLMEYKDIIIASPTDESIADAIVNEIKENYKGQEIQILTDNRNQELADYFADKLSHAISGVKTRITKDVSQLKQLSEIVNETIDDGSVIQKEYFTPIITVLVSGSNELGNAYINKIRNMNAENLQAYGVKYVTAYDIYNTANKQVIDDLTQIGFTFATDRLVNVYGAKEKEIINNFMDNYCIAPNEYQQIGFDIFYDLADRMNWRGDVLNNLNGEQTRLATKFKYEKENKAWINNGVRIVRLHNKDKDHPAEEAIKD